MRNWTIAFVILALLAGGVCLGADTPAELNCARVLMVLFGSLGAYAAASCRLQARARRRPGRAGPLDA